jgi:endonuclease-3
MAPDKRAERLFEIARLIVATCGGDLAAELRARPTAKARAMLKRFPGVGEPGADRILLFGDYAAQPAVDSNGLRALVRMGFLIERPNWSQTYRDAIKVIAERGRPDAGWLKTAYLVLRAHGKELCKRSAPICLPCPFDQDCAHSVTSTL